MNRTLPDDLGRWSLFFRLIPGGTMNLYRLFFKSGAVFHLLYSCGPHDEGEPHRHFDLCNPCDTLGPFEFDAVYFEENEPDSPEGDEQS